MQLMRYHCIVRTTVAIDDRLLQAARDAARRRGTTLGHLVEDALRRELASVEAAPPAPPVPVFTRGTGLRPGVDASSTRGLLATLDDDAPTDRLR
jgi:hypothetical protein